MFDFINDAGEVAVEKLFLQVIGGFTIADLRWATDSGASLLLLTQENNPKLLRMASGLARGFNCQGYHLNTTNVLKWLKDKRPEVYVSVNVNPRMRKWLDRNVEEFRRFLFS